MTIQNDLSKVSRRDFLKVGGNIALGGLLAIKGKHGDEHLISSDNVEQPNILILVLDTLSARHMSTYGYLRETTPNISRFAQRSMVYHNHHAAGNFTPPGTASILTGTYPWSHRAMHTSATIHNDYIRRNIFNLLAEDYHSTAYTHNSLAMSILFQLQESVSELMSFETLTLQENTLSMSHLWEDFRMADWAETIIRGVGHPPSSLYLSLLDPLRLRPRADIVEKYGIDFPRGIPSANLDSLYFLLEDAINWLIENLPALPSPYLVYFHLMPPHEPYRPRKEFIDVFNDDLSFTEKPRHYFSNMSETSNFQAIRKEYDEYLAYADAEFGRLYDQLLNSNMLEKTLIILTSDHGQLFERGIHGHVTPTLYAPLLHVPLLISRPGQNKREDFHVSTSAVDLLPTILQFVGKPIPQWIEGMALPGFSEPEKDRKIFTLEAKESDLTGPIRQGTIALIKNQFKLIYYFGYSGFEDKYELYDWKADTEEMTDLYQAVPRIASEMREDIELAMLVNGLKE